jgi:hypothetical protein
MKELSINEAKEILPDGYHIHGYRMKNQQLMDVMLERSEAINFIKRSEGNLELSHVLNKSMKHNLKIENGETYFLETSDLRIECLKKRKELV